MWNSFPLSTYVHHYWTVHSCSGRCSPDSGIKGAAEKAVQVQQKQKQNKTDKRPPSHNWPVRSSVPMSDWQRDNGPSAMHKTTLTQLASQKFCAPARLAAWQRTICCLHAHLHNIPRHQFWSVQTLVGRKLFSSLEDLQCMAALVQRTGASSWDINRRPFNLFYFIKPSWLISM